MKLRLLIGHIIAFCAVTVLVVVLAPAVLVFGEAMNRRHRRRLLASQGLREWARRRDRAGVVLSNPVWIALTAPARWLADHLRPRVGSGRRRGGRGDPGAGVREPRRPRPDLPAGAMALTEPRQFG